MYLETYACLSSGLAWDNSVGAEMSSSDGMLMKGKCQGELAVCSAWNISLQGVFDIMEGK